MNHVADDDSVIAAGVDGVDGTFDKSDGSFEHGRAGVFDPVR